MWFSVFIHCLIVMKKKPELSDTNFDSHNERWVNNIKPTINNNRSNTQTLIHKTAEVFCLHFIWFSELKPGRFMLAVHFTHWWTSLTITSLFNKEQFIQWKKNSFQTASKHRITYQACKIKDRKIQQMPASIWECLGESRAELSQKWNFNICYTIQKNWWKVHMHTFLSNKNNQTKRNEKNVRETEEY